MVVPPDFGVCQKNGVGERKWTRLETAEATDSTGDKCDHVKLSVMIGKEICWCCLSSWSEDSDESIIVAFFQSTAPLFRLGFFHCEKQTSENMTAKKEAATVTCMVRGFVRKASLCGVFTVSPVLYAVLLVGNKSDGRSRRPPERWIQSLFNHLLVKNRCLVQMVLVRNVRTRWPSPRAADRFVRVTT